MGDSTGRQTCSALFILSALLPSVLTMAGCLEGAEAYNTHEPILISGDSVSGVTSGTGTELDPYIIEGWVIEFSGDCIDIEGSDAHILIRDLLLRPDPSSGLHAGPGISLGHDVSNVTIQNCTFEGEVDGPGGWIGLYLCHNVTITGNQIPNGVVYVGDSKDVGVFGNDVRAIRLARSVGISIDSNSVDPGGIWIDGDRLEHFNSHSISSSNVVRGGPVRYLKNQTSVAIAEDFNGGQVILSNCTGVRVSNINLKNASGIHISFSAGVVVSNIVASQGASALVFLNASNVSVVDSVFTATEWDDDLVLYNHASVYMREVTEGRVLRCNFSAGVSAIEMMQSVNLSIISCLVTGAEGVNCHWSANATIRGCTLAPNSGQVAVRLNDCRDCRIYQNNLQTDRIEDSSHGAVNHWDGGYPAGGNYWSYNAGYDNFSGPNQDARGSDGIDDEPYLLDGYPLLDPYDYPHPRAVFTLERVNDSARSYLVDASMCWDPTDPTGILEIRWDWNGDGRWDTDWSTNKINEHRYSKPGDYTIVMEVRNSDGLTSTSQKDVGVEGIFSTQLVLAILAICAVSLLCAFLLLRRRRSGRLKTRI